MLTYALYAAATVLLALVDALRIRAKNRRVKAPVGNNDISHPVSWTMGVTTAIALYMLTQPITWHAVLYAVGFTATRFLLFDLSLNVFINFLVFPRPIDYVSMRSNSVTESRLNRIPFWWRRMIAAGVLIAVITIQFFLL